ncbi:peptidoglycan recognition family protein [Selenomonas sp.]|jgi:N-acetylmuramoyl-L-alanine amidase|uniref:peptidoglycan recognition protein family protein n=1 Tax=Selenomonas sp. TaxID=2053611 RepID=UPI003A102F5D
MKRRDFIKQMMLGAAGAVLLPLAGPLAAAEAAWQTGGAAGVRVKETYLSFRSLTNREQTDVIILHHIGNTNADVSAATVHQWHLANGWAGIGYHYLIRKDGTIERGRPRDTVGAHCYGENWHSVGVNIVGNFETNEPTAAQIDAAERLVAVLCRLYGLRPSGATIKGHRDFNATACPGENLYAMLPDVIAGVQSYYM